MASITEKLKKQLTNEDVQARQDAENCLIIANKLLELSDGHIWSSDWNVLVRTIKYPIGETRYKPSVLGKIFINGLKNL